VTRSLHNFYHHHHFFLSLTPSFPGIEKIGKASPGFAQKCRSKALSIMIMIGNIGGPDWRQERGTPHTDEVRKSKKRPRDKALATNFLFNTRGRRENLVEAL